VYGGLAIDTRRQKLYYTDEATNNSKVGELSTDGTAHRILISDVGSRQRALVFDDDNRCPRALLVSLDEISVITADPAAPSRQNYIHCVQITFTFLFVK